MLLLDEPIILRAGSIAKFRASQRRDHYLADRKTCVRDVCHRR
nr:hypothetical protein [Mesorhizobium sp.]